MFRMAVGLAFVFPEFDSPLVYHLTHTQLIQCTTIFSIYFYVEEKKCKILFFQKSLLRHVLGTIPMMEYWRHPGLNEYIKYAAIQFNTLLWHLARKTQRVADEYHKWLT